ncbi:MAG: hypothetical protein ABJE95_21005 [Byssovorax sp.]
MPAPPTTVDKTFLAAMAFVALFGCKLFKKESDDEPAHDPSIGFGNGTNLGAKPGSGAGISPTPAPAPVAPSLGGGRSATPTISEWSGVSEVSVRNSSSLGCETKMVREWLRVTCHALAKDNAPTGVQVIRPTGDRDYFIFNSAGIASLVMPVRVGVDAEARYTWQKWGTRTLRVSWPVGAPSASMTFDRGDR